MQITSHRNPRVKYLRSLQVRKYRRRERRFLIEGIRIVEEALDCDAPVETLVYSPELLVSERARAMLDRVEAERHLVLSGEVFASLSKRDLTQGIGAVVRIEDSALVDIPQSNDMLVVVAHQLRDPGNLGSVIRTADAVGATGVIIVEPAVDLYDPETVRATMGSLFALPIVRLDDETALIRWFEETRATGLPLLVAASSAHAEVLYFDVDYRRPLALLVGSERHGLPAIMRDASDKVVRLPMDGRATSLNVSAALAALAYEIVRQRRTGRT